MKAGLKTFHWALAVGLIRLVANLQCHGIQVSFGAEHESAGDGKIAQDMPEAEETFQEKPAAPNLVRSASTNASMDRASFSFPAEITTTDGKTYTGVTLLRVEPDGIVLSYTVEGGGIGLSKIKHQRLPEALRTTFAFDSQSAADFEKQQAQGQADLRERMWEEHRDASRRLAARLAREQAEAQVQAERMRIAKENAELERKLEAERARIARETAEAARKEQRRYEESVRRQNGVEDQIWRQSQLLERLVRGY